MSASEASLRADIVEIGRRAHSYDEIEAQYARERARGAHSMDAIAAVMAAIRAATR